MGRLLVTLILWEAKALREPILYLSLYLKTHRSEYYDLLQTVRETGDWERWIEFFLTGVSETADQGVNTAERLLELFREDQSAVEALGRGAANALRVHAHLQRQGPAGDVVRPVR